MTPLQVISEVISAGPLDTGELEGLLGVYRRGMEEVEGFLRQKQ